MEEQKQISTLTGVILIVATAIVLFGGVFAYEFMQTESFPVVAPAVSQKLIGGDKDSHGCLPAAGYSWCEAKQKCLRAWEEPCATKQ